MYSFLLVLLALDSFVLIAVVLMQAGQGGGMAASFGGASSSSGTIFGTRQAGNLLTKASWWSGGIFLALAFMLSLASTRNRRPQSILDQAFPNQAAPPVAAPGVPSNLPVTPVPTTKAPSTTKKP